MGHSSRLAQFMASQFRLNQAGSRGGAVAIADASPLLTNCAFTENQSDASGGGGGAVAVFWQVPLAANPSVPAHSSAPRFVHTTFTGNQSSVAANIHAAVLTTPWLINSIFSDGLVRPASPTLVGPRQLHGCLLAAPAQSARLSDTGLRWHPPSLAGTPGFGYILLERRNRARIIRLVHPSSDGHGQ